MSVVNKTPKIITNALTAKAGKKVWENLSPETRSHLIKTNAGLIAFELARKLFNKKTFIAGAVTTGLIWGVRSLLRSRKK